MRFRITYTLVSQKLIFLYRVIFLPQAKPLYGGGGGGVLIPALRPLHNCTVLKPLEGSGAAPPEAYGVYEIVKLGMSFSTQFLATN